MIARELLFALVFLVGFLFAGRFLLNAIGLTEATLTVAGGLILFLISLRMVFPPPGGTWAVDIEKGATSRSWCGWWSHSSPVRPSSRRCSPS